MSDRVREILSWYAGNPPGVFSNLYRMLSHGKLAGTGKMVVLPVDQGFEHGPVRSFAKVPEGNDPRYHFQLAIDSGVAAHAAPLGALQTGAVEFAGRLPLILKLNNSDSLTKGGDPCPAITGSVQDALELGCTAIGFTIYPGSDARNTMFEQIRELVAEAKSVGLPTIIWSYPRGSGISKEGELGIDIISYGAHVACQLGGHIIKVKAPSAYVEQAEAKKMYDTHKVPISTLTERTRQVVQSTFGGRRIVIFSGGAAKAEADVLTEVQALAAGGAFGSIMGRNVFQRPRAEALALLEKVHAAYL